MKAHHLCLLGMLLAPLALAEDIHVRTLAASCAACHGPGGNSVGGTPVLAGLDRTHFVAQMQAFRGGARPATVMHHHARGLNDEEIRLLADYFAAQPRQAVQPPLPLKDF